MGSPTAVDVHQASPLDNFAIAYQQAQTEFAAPRGAPSVPVPHKSDSYYIWGKALEFQDGLKARAPGSDFAELSQSLSTGSYACVQYAGERRLADEMTDDEDPGVKLEQSAVRFLMHQALIRRERMWAEKALATGWTGQTDQTGVDSDSPSTAEFSQWQRGGSDPLGVLEQAIDAVGTSCGRRANTIAFGRRVWRRLKQHADVRDIVKHTSPDAASPELLAKYLEVAQVIVSGAVYNSADEGQDASMTRIADTAVFVGYIDPEVTLESMSALKTFVWMRKARAGQYNPVTGMRLRSFYDDDKEATRVRGDIFQDVKVTCADAGCYFASAVASS